MPNRSNRKQDKTAESTIDDDAEIGKSDISKAKSTWRKDAPEKFKDLLDATPTNGA